MQEGSAGALFFGCVVTCRTCKSCSEKFLMMKRRRSCEGSHCKNILGPACEIQRRLVVGKCTTYSGNDGPCFVMFHLISHLSTRSRNVMIYSSIFYSLFILFIPSIHLQTASAFQLSDPFGIQGESPRSQEEKKTKNKKQTKEDPAVFSPVFTASCEKSRILASC